MRDLAVAFIVVAAFVFVALLFLNPPEMEGDPNMLDDNRLYEMLSGGATP